MRRRFAIVILSGVPFLLLARVAGAGVLYYDFAGGLAKYQDDASFFGSGASGSTSTGYAVNNGIFASFGAPQRALAFQLGVQDRFSGASDAGQSYNLNATYAVVRFQLGRLYFGGGVSPWVFESSSASSKYMKAQGAIAYLGEGGLLWPITPKFSLGVQAAAQFVDVNGTQSPVVLDATVSMRFYFGRFGSGSGRGGSDSGDSTEYSGRYPFGNFR